ncbi:hypothetical protein [Mesorhizobium huakuii]|uniref:Portal protein n=1 Tax=Mesorhizobium huakuii TaxID=28104 RepID=A0A7G6T0U0_9HYPH|nr:hypothetical protein [Mesorhizobium huakuii]QND60372.1 hypothetical protein HB778_30370 [Mesorhizobium huakuii]
MFDVGATDGSVRKRRYQSPIPADATEGKPANGGSEYAAGADDSGKKGKPVAALDSEKMVAFHHRMLALYTGELDRQNANRIEQAIDEDFYDNIQYTETDAQTLTDRGQIPLVYNVISASIDWVLGTEKRARADFKVLPRRKAQSKPAERKTQLMKYLSDVNRSPFHRSRAFEDTVKVGIGWLEDGVQDEDEDEPLYSRYESWRNILHDSAATEMDLKDGRYIFRSKWVDLDIACAIFKKRRALLERSASDSVDYQQLDLYGDEAMDQLEMSLEQRGNSTTSDRLTGYQRRRVRITEAWITIPGDCDKMSGGTFTGEIYDPQSPGHSDEIDSGEATTKKKMGNRMHVAIFTSAGMLWFSESPYRHNRFPFTPIWGYKRGRDGMPYGLIRRLRDIQTDINKRASKALYIMSTNKVIMDEDALPKGTSIDDFRDEVARPDAVLLKKKGADMDINVDRSDVQFHMDFMSRSISLIQSASGVTDENMGRQTNATSGVAIGKRQDQGAMATAKLFDNLRFAAQVQGEKQLANIEQFVSEKKAFRITNMRGTPDYIEVNDGLPENDIIRSKADYVISEADWRASMRQAAADELLEASKMWPPEVTLVVLDLIVENLDIPNVDEIVKRIRTMTGQKDPDQEELTPEQQQQEAEMAKQKQMQEAGIMIQLRAELAKALKDEATAQQIVSKIVSDKIAAQLSALTTAAQAISMPATVDMADHILAEAGFVSKSDEAQPGPQPQPQGMPGLDQPGAQPPPQRQPIAAPPTEPAQDDMMGLGAPPPPTAQPQPGAMAPA